MARNKASTRARYKKAVGGLTDEQRQEQDLADKRARQILKESGVAAQGLSVEEYNNAKQNLETWLNLHSV